MKQIETYHSQSMSNDSITNPESPISCAEERKDHDQGRKDCQEDHVGSQGADAVYDYQQVH